MIALTGQITIADEELEWNFICSSGPGGQNVNKVSTAVQLRWNIAQSKSLHEIVHHRLLKQLENRLTKEGEIIIEAKVHRSQKRNREEALDRLREIVLKALERPKFRVKSNPTRGSVERRLQEKKVSSDIKKRRNEKF